MSNEVYDLITRAIDEVAEGDPPQPKKDLEEGDLLMAIDLLKEALKRVRQ